MQESIGILELVALVGGQTSDVEANTRLIRGAASIAEAGEMDVTFLGNPKYLPALRSSRAGAVLVPLDFNEAIYPVVIRVATIR